MGALLGSLNHVAMVTASLDRVHAFYCGVLGATLREQHEGPGFKMSVVELGENSYLNFFEFPDRSQATEHRSMFERGHIDHLGLTAVDEAAFYEIRRRLIDLGAANDEITTFGPQISVMFNDPDGMEGEVCLVLDPSIPGHEPRPYQATDGEPSTANVGG